MTQPEMAVGGDANAPVDAQTDALNAFEELAADFLGEDNGAPDEEDHDETPGEPTDKAGEPEETEEGSEPEADDLPAIDPPNSLTAEEKEAFKSLPREAQEFTARRIGELEKGFQSKAQEAARARQEAEHTAIQQVSQLERQYAEQFQQMSQNLLPQRPNPELLRYDPQAFYSQQADYESALAQQQQLQLQAQELSHQAAQREAYLEQEDRQRQDALLAEKFPEFMDPAQRTKLADELTSIASALGYPSELINQARAEDILAMKQALEWKAKADQLDSLNKAKMAKVRDAKGKPKVTTPGVVGSGEGNRKMQAEQAWEAARGSKGAARVDAFGEYLKLSGHI